VKYGPTGQTIAVTLERSKDGDWARLWVEDEGPGIPAAERTRIWEPFHRLERDSNSAIAGSGIGLALVRTLTEAHGGRVSVDDGEQRGSRFVVEIPCAPRTPPGAPPVMAGAGAYTTQDEQLVTGR
jgi:signal transduction histidine kinase